MIIITDATKSETVPESVLARYRLRMANKGFLLLNLIGAETRATEDGRFGRSFFYIDTALCPATTMGDINDLADTVFSPRNAPFQPADMIKLSSSWHYVPTTGIAVIVIEWQI